jgi:predicted RNase H-like HicB family nuclease
MEFGEDNIGVRFPDFPGAISCGDTINQAQENAKECLIDYIHFLLEDDDPIPEASSESTIEYDSATERLCRITVDMAELYPEEFVKKQGGARPGAGRPKLSDDERCSESVVIRLTKTESAALNKLTSVRGMTKSALLRDYIVKESSKLDS